MSKKDTEPKSILIYIITWLIVLAVIGYVLDIIYAILLLHWKAILGALIVTGGIAGIIIYWRWKNRWY